jgi:cholest-4-en-3-one 26-monooxygenase
MESRSVDVLDPEVYAEGVPHDALTWLRHNHPVSYQTTTESGRKGEGGAWIITKHADVDRINKDAVHFCSGLGHSLKKRRWWDHYPSMLAMDDPQHLRLRRLVSRGFTPRVIRLFEVNFRKMAVDIIESALKHEECEFVSAVATELPLQAICQLLGAPIDDRQQVFAWSNMLVSSEDPDLVDSDHAFNEAVASIALYCEHLTELRRRDPQDDVVSALVHEHTENSLSDDELIGFVILLFAAGSETTRSAIAGGLLALVQFPDQLELLRSRTDEVINTAIDEILRWQTPVVYMRRTATCDIEFADHAIKRGDAVAMMYASANRDEDVFENPFTFDILRTPNPHISFGTGKHFCMGANLAKLEMRCVFEELLARTDTIELAGPVRRMQSSTVNALKELPLRMCSV